jgi:hypothetical protein
MTATAKRVKKTTAPSTAFGIQQVCQQQQPASNSLVGIRLLLPAVPCHQQPLPAPAVQRHHNLGESFRSKNSKREKQIMMTAEQRRSSNLPHHQQQKEAQKVAIPASDASSNMHASEEAQARQARPRRPPCVLKAPPPVAAMPAVAALFGTA